MSKYEEGKQLDSFLKENFLNQNLPSTMSEDKELDQLASNLQMIQMETIELH